MARRRRPPSPTLHWATHLVAAGVNVMPINLSSKQPCTQWAALQGDRLVDQDWDRVDKYLCTWWDAGRDARYGLGAVTGSVSGIVVVDVDSDEGREVFDAACGGVRTVMARTPRGHHYWFRHPGQRLTNRARVNGVPLDVRADGGYVVCPPTMRRDGKGYTWVLEPVPGDVGMWPPAPMPEALMEVLWPPRPEPRRRSPVETVLDSGNGNGYARAALEKETAIVRSAPKGARNSQLNHSVWAIARLDELSDEEILTGFLGATSLPEYEARRTIQSALDARRRRAS